MLRLSWKWRHLPLVVGRHREIRDLYPLGVFWRRSHGLLLLAALGVALGRRRRVAVVLTGPYARELLGRRGTHLRGRLRAVTEAPGRVAIDAVELAALASGSLRHRTLFL